MIVTQLRILERGKEYLVLVDFKKKVRKKDFLVQNQKIKYRKVEDYR